MMAVSLIYFPDLLKPISEENPCGCDPDSVASVAELTSERVFGQIRPLLEGTDWHQVRQKALLALRACHDLGVLAYLAAAVLRTDGLAPFGELLQVAAAWLRDFKETVYPRIETGAVERTNVLNNFSDSMAILDALRRCPFIKDAKLCDFSLRDYNLAVGKLEPTEADKRRAAPSEELLSATLAAAPAEDLAATLKVIEKAQDAIATVYSLSPTRPNWAGLTAELDNIKAFLAPELAKRTVIPVAIAAAPEGSSEAVHGSFAIRTRGDVIVALDAISRFFRDTEPSSAVPLFIDRARRLVGKSFLEMLNDIAPESANQVRKASGVVEEPAKGAK